MSRITNYPFYAALTHLEDLYGVQMGDDDFESVAYTAWQHIGNRECRTYRAELFPFLDKETGKYAAQVPCNCTIIEAITAFYEDYHSTSSKENYPNTFNSVTEQYIESGKSEQPTDYLEGRLVHYEQVGDMLYFSEPYRSLKILYKGIYADDDGLPYLNFKEVDAIACYCAYTALFKKALKAMDQNSLQMATALQQMWLKKCSQARTPEYLNQNEMDHILDAHSSWNRKVYGISFKADMK